MLAVFYKSDEEIENSRYNTRRDGGVCPTYVITKNGTRIDTKYLQDDEIMSFVWQGVKQAVKEKKATLAAQPELFTNWQKYPTSQAVTELLYAVKDWYRPSLASVKTVVDLLHNQDLDVCACTAYALNGSALQQEYDNVKDITEFLRGHGYQKVPVTKEDLLATINYLQQSEKQQQTHRTAQA